VKKLILTALLFGVTVSAKPQGFIFLDNINNVSLDPLATANGLFWLSTTGTPVLINQDFNATFYGGATSNSLSLIKTFLLSNGTARGDNGFGPGTFLDPTGASYPILGSTTFAFFQVQAWTGNFSSYAAALAAGAPAAQSPVFVNPVCQPPCAPPDLVNMPAMVLSGIPEPSTLALCGIGSLLALMCWQRKRITGESVRY